MFILVIAHLQHAPGILKHRARLHRSKGDDLGDRVVPVFFLHISNDFTAPRFAEIDIEIGIDTRSGIGGTAQTTGQV